MFWIIRQICRLRMTSMGLFSKFNALLKKPFKKAQISQRLSDYKHKKPKHKNSLHFFATLSNDLFFGRLFSKKVFKFKKMSYLVISSVPSIHEF